MSKVIALAGAQTAVNVQVKQRTAKLNFLFNTPDANAADWATLKARMNAVIVSVDLQNPGGQQESLINKVPLGTLAELFSILEGFVDVTDNGASMDVRFSVEMSHHGALLLDNNTSLVVNITGMVANDNLSVYATDFPIASRNAIKCNVLRFNSGAAQAVGLQNGSHLHLPVASFEKLELYYPNGVSITLEKEEMIAWALEGNEVQGVLLGVVKMGYIDFLSINTVDAVSCKVTLSADANGYLFTQVNVG